MATSIRPAPTPPSSSTAPAPDRILGGFQYRRRAGGSGSFLEPTATITATVRLRTPATALAACSPAPPQPITATASASTVTATLTTTRVPRLPVMTRIPTGSRPAFLAPDRASRIGGPSSPVVDPDGGRARHGPAP